MKKRRSISGIGKSFIVIFSIAETFAHAFFGMLDLVFVLPIPIVAQAIGGASAIMDVMVSTTAVVVYTGFFAGLPGRLRSRFTVTLMLIGAQWFVSFIPELGGIMALILMATSTIRTVAFIRKVDAEDAEYNKKQMPA